jgi:hypothetical protein
MTRTLAALLVALGTLSGSGFPDILPRELEAPPGLLLQFPGLRELSPSDLAADPGRFPFPVGERLVYAVRYFGIDVGPATLEVARFVAWRGHRYAHLVATARTNEFWSAFYRVDDRSEAFVDLDTGRIARSRTRLLHGKGETREEIQYDWDTHFLHVRKVKLHKEILRELALDFGPFVFDVFDSFYALREVPFREGLEVEIPIYASNQIHGLRVKTTGRRNAAVAVLGSAPQPVFELHPVDTVDGKAEEAGNGRVLVLADASHVPVRLDGWFRWTRFVQIGGVSAELVQWERGRPEWPAARPPPWQAPPVAAASVDGRPQWDPPPGVRAARKRTGVVPFERRRDFDPRQVGAAAPREAPTAP